MSETARPRPIIIDTDMAPDDWMAILYLLQSPLADVRAITVTATGEAHKGPGVRNALRLLALAERAGVPVAGGRGTPLRGDHHWPLLARLFVDWRFGLPLPRTRQRPSPQSAAGLLTSLIMGSPEKVTLLAIGPLTNVAEALLARPELADRLEMIYIMGGAVDVPGNITPSGFTHLENHFAEWNIYCDPYAASVVFASGAPITLVPLDVTNTAPITPEFYERSRELQGTPAARFVHRVLSRLKPLIERGDYYFWDPLTAVLITHDHIGTYRDMALKVVVEEGPESGRTLAAEDGHRIRVCTSVDVPRFEEIFLQTLNGTLG